MRSSEASCPHLANEDCNSLIMSTTAEGSEEFRGRKINTLLRHGEQMMFFSFTHREAKVT